MIDFEQEGSTEPEETGAPEGLANEFTDELDNASDDELDKLISGEALSEVVPPNEQETPVEEAAPVVEEPQQTPETPQQLQENLEKANERIANLQRELGRRSTEVGTLRAALRQEVQAKEQRIPELEIDRPMDAMKTMLEVERLKEQEQHLANEEEDLTRRSAFYETIPSVLKPEEFDIEAIRTELRLDNVPEDRIEGFLSRIDRQDPSLVIMAAKRAYYGKALSRLVPVVQQLKAENDRLKSQSANQGESLAQKISQQLKKPLSVPMSRTPVKTVNIDEMDLDSLSEAEINEIIKTGSLNGINTV